MKFDHEIFEPLPKITKDNAIKHALELISGAANPVNLWWPILNAPSGIFPAGTKDRIFPIFYCCVFDLFESVARYLKPIDEELGKLGVGLLRHNIREISLQCTWAGEFIDQFTISEQVYLRAMRNRFVHGYLHGTLQDLRFIKVSWNGNIIRRTMATSEIQTVSQCMKGNDDLEKIRHLRVREVSALRNYIHGISELLTDPSEVKLALESDHVIYFENRSLFQK